MPVHAGRLRPGERLVFGVVFILMAAIVGGVTMTAARAGVPAAASQRVAAAAPVLLPAAAPVVLPADGAAGTAAAPQDAPGRAGSGSIANLDAGSPLLDAQLAGALQPLVSGGQRRLAVGVVDVATGAAASYRSSELFRCADVAAADVLAVLLLRHQASGAPPRAGTAKLAADMVDGGSDAAAARLWQAVGGGTGVAAGNAQLQLARTRLGSASSWRGATSTVADQLQLLADLSLSGSPLDQAQRDYAMGLMDATRPAQRWGARAAATAGTPAAVTSGAVRIGQLWAAASIGVVQRDGQVLLVVVMSGHNKTEHGGIAAVRAAAAAAAGVVLSG